MARAELIIGNRNYSSWSLRPWLALMKVGADFAEIRVPLYTADYKQRLLSYSPGGKVPVYREGSVLVWESLAILEHLAQRYPALWPASAPDAAHARSISAEMHAGFAALRTAMPMNCRAAGRSVEITPEVAADIRRVQEIWTVCRAASRRRGPWLFGGFTIADAMYAPVVSRFQTYGIQCTGDAAEYAAAVLEDPHVQQWYAAARQEPETIEGAEVGIR